MTAITSVTCPVFENVTTRLVIWWKFSVECVSKCRARVPGGDGFLPAWTKHSLMAVLVLLGIWIFELALKVTCICFCCLVRRVIGVNIKQIYLVLFISWVFSLPAKLDGALIWNSTATLIWQNVTPICPDWGLFCSQCAAKWLVLAISYCDCGSKSW